MSARQSTLLMDRTKITFWTSTQLVTNAVKGWKEVIVVILSRQQTS